ncbi:MAG: cytochrome o ubiquinol oxidase, subunit [Candidatus Adlerbacteria bacterium]|nr:cytochrome o ubiquinol oxidase, subunit [Candidatus Adlerbacteria bacterium]
MNLFGILTPAAFIHPGFVENLAGSIVLVAAIGALSIISYLHAWRYLWREWLTSLNHQRIGVMYIILALTMLLRGLIDAMMMRSQQALTAQGAVGYLAPDHFAQVFTAHGVIMIFFVAMTFMFGLINLVVPLQIGAKDVAYPLLNSISFWLTATSAMLVNVSLVVGQFAAVGWLAYPPLSELSYSPGVGVDYFIWALEIGGVATLLSAINFIATILMMRRPGLRMMQLPMFTWTTLASMLMALFAFPILTVTLALLALDRTLGMHFFTPELGGNAMMYVNLIWAWGHPEVYILILPMFGVFSEVVSTFSHKRLFGYTSMVIATMLIAILSFGVWVHHFFTMGASANVNAVFGIATMIIAIPTGVKVFNWLFTMFRGRIVFATPMLWFMGFLATFIIGGMTGVLMSIPGVDFELHNSLFLVAHFHNMVIGGVLFGAFAGLSYWWPRFTGFKLHEGLGKLAFWLWLIGFIVAFTPLYILGLMGATRRIDAVDPSLGYSTLFLVAALGAGIIALGVLAQGAQIVWSIIKRRDLKVGNNPWESRGPEWTSPLPRIDTADNSGIGFYIAILSFGFGFGMVWHMWWLPPVSLVAIAALLLVRSFGPEPHYLHAHDSNTHEQ